MKKLLLIYPRVEYGIYTFNEPLALGIIAALTPDNYEIELIDENYENFEFKSCDLVGITATTPSVNRAYYISSVFQKHNIPTVIGGIHVSLLPHEAINYCSSVVVGDAEQSWPQLIKDFESGNMKKIYGALQTNEVHHIVTPIRKIYNKYPYQAATVESSRGCPRNCKYCSIVSFYKNKYYERDADDIINELKTLKNKTVFFSDDNFIGQLIKKKRLLYILNCIVPLKIKWYAFASANIIKHPDLLKLFQKSGCIMLYIGFESDEKQSLSEVNKLNDYYLNNVDTKTIKNYVKTIHKYKIAVMGGFIYGFDSDTIESMKNRLERVQNSGVDWYSISLLTPLPGSSIFEKVNQENRLIYTDFPKDWSLYNYMKAVHNPLQITGEDMDNFVQQSHQLYFNEKYTKKRFFKTLLSLRSIKITYFFYLWVSHHWLHVGGFSFIKRFNAFYKLYKQILRIK